MTAARRPDSQEDPAHDVDGGDNGDGGDDWAAEGGALTEGPATDPEDATPERD